MEESITITASDLEAVLRNWMAEIDYDLHKAIEMDEETGEDGYPEQAAKVFADLRKRRSA
jgi:hypothetical protein